MTIRTFPYGPLGSNLYLIEHNDRYLVIDPAVRPAKCGFEEYIGKVEAIIITHGHFDHILFADLWQQEAQKASEKTVPVYIHKLDMPALTDPQINLSYEFGLTDVVAADPCDIYDIDGQILLGDDSDGLRVKVIHTPGHSRGEVCVVLEEIKTGKAHMFTGDMLFAGSVGRSDFDGSDPGDMMKSIEVLKSLETDYKIYPGHGPSTTLEYEKKHNPYFL